MRSSRLFYAALGLLAATTACSQQPPTAPTTDEQTVAVPTASQLQRDTQQANIRRDTQQPNVRRDTQQPNIRRDTQPRRDTDQGRRDTDRRRYSYRYSYIPYFETYPYTYPPYYQGYAQNTVVISGYQFQPSNLEVPVGTTVTWINQDSVAHTVTSPLPEQATTTGAFDGVLQPGQSYTYTFNLPGRIDYYCRFHPGMRGSVSVGGAY